MDHWTNDLALIPCLIIVGSHLAGVRARCLKLPLWKKQYHILVLGFLQKQILRQRFEWDLNLVRPRVYLEGKANPSRRLEKWDKEGKCIVRPVATVSDWSLTLLGHQCKVYTSAIQTSEWGRWDSYTPIPVNHWLTAARPRPLLGMINSPTLLT